MAKELFEDDGTLACLGLTRNERDKRYTCPEEQQTNLINKTFWLQDFFPDVQTRFGTRHLYKATYEKDDPDGKAFKVFTGAAACKYVLEKLAELGKFPRRVTLKKEGKIAA